MVYDKDHDHSINHPPPKDDSQFTRKQLAERWKTSTETIKRRERAGLLKAIKLGRTVRYRLSDVLAVEEGACS